MALSWTVFPAVSAPSSEATLAAAQQASDTLLKCLQEMPVSKTGEVDPDESATSQYRLAESIGTVTRIKSLLSSSNLTEAQRVCQQLLSQYPASPGCKAETTALTESIDAALLESTRRFKTDFEQLKTKIGIALLEAKTAGQLDAPLKQAQDFASASRETFGHSEEANALPQFVARWQEYLAAEAAGEVADAVSILNQMSNDTARTLVVPRSKVLERRLALKKQPSPMANDGQNEVDEILQTVVSAKDLASAKQKLTALSVQRFAPHDAKSQIAHISTLEQISEMIDDGDPLLALHALRSFRSSGSDRIWAVSVVDELFTRALHASIPSPYRPNPEPTSIMQLVTAAGEKMKQAEDWTTLWQLYTVVAATVGNRNSELPGLREDTQAIEKFLHAQRLEASGQLALALNAYNGVLAFTGANGPYDAAERKIQELRGPRKEELLADQKRDAETPRAPQSQPRMMYDPRRPGMSAQQESSQLEAMVERAVEEKVGAYLAREKAKAEPNRTETKPNRTP